MSGTDNQADWIAACSGVLKSLSRLAIHAITKLLESGDALRLNLVEKLVRQPIKFRNAISFAAPLKSTINGGLPSPALRCILVSRLSADVSHS